MRSSIICLIAFVASIYAMPADPAERIELVAGIKIQAPETTPFDSDPSLRTAYLEEYTISYRAVMALADIGCHMTVQGPAEKPMRAGWKDGRTEALRNPSKAAAHALGIPFDKYQELLATTFPQK